MTEHADPINSERPRTKIIRQGASEAVYGLGFIGALVYFIQHAANVGMGLLGLLKAIVWPAFVVYRFLELLKM